MKRKGYEISYPGFKASSSDFVWNSMRSRYSSRWKEIRQVLKDFHIENPEFSSRQEFEDFFSHALQQAFDKAGWKKAFIQMDFTIKSYDQKPASWIESEYPKGKYTIVNIREARLALSKDRFEIKVLAGRDQEGFNTSLQQLNTLHQLGIIDIGILILPSSELLQALKFEKTEEKEIDLDKEGPKLFKDYFLNVRSLKA